MTNPLVKKKQKKQRHNVGAEFGDLFHHPHTGEGPIKITMIQYDGTEYYEEIFQDVESCKNAVRPGLLKWINVDGIHDQQAIADFGKWLGIHPLTQEDITHIDSRPKFEEYSRYVVSILKMLYWEQGHIMYEHLCILLFEDTVLTFQEPHAGDSFDLVRSRLRESKGRVRKMGSDYLSYALIDDVVDHYIFILEKFGEKVEALDEEVLYHPSKRIMVQLHALKKENLVVRKIILPAREMVFNMMRSDTELLSATNNLYLRDVHDHINKVSDTIDSYRESLSDIMEVYLSNNANKLNEVMKTLTTISAIFIPVTFIAGVYGMNFKHMPELESPLGYWITISIMIVLMVSMGWYFKKRKWW
jgi:magnesium transporter